MAREARRRKILTISNLKLCQLQFQIWELWINWSGTIPIWNCFISPVAQSLILPFSLSRGGVQKVFGRKEGAKDLELIQNEPVNCRIAEMSVYEDRGSCPFSAT